MGVLRTHEQSYDWSEVEESTKYSTVRENLEESVSLTSLYEDTAADSFNLSLSSTFTPVFKSSPIPRNIADMWLQLDLVIVLFVLILKF